MNITFYRGKLMNQEQKALEGKLFQASDDELKKLKFKAHKYNQIYNKNINFIYR